MLLLSASRFLSRNDCKDRVMTQAMVHARRKMAIALDSRGSKLNGGFFGAACSACSYRVRGSWLASPNPLMTKVEAAAEGSRAAAAFGHPPKYFSCIGGLSHCYTGGPAFSASLFSEE
jgi:hypothetical protein